MDGFHHLTPYMRGSYGAGEHDLLGNWDAIPLGLLFKSRLVAW